MSTRSLAPTLGPTAPSRRLVAVRALSEGALVAAHLALPLGIALALPVALAGGAPVAWDGAGLSAWLGGVAFAYVLDRLSPSRSRHDATGNAVRTRWLASTRPWLLAAGGLGFASLLVALALEPSRLGPPVAALGLVVLAYPLLSRAPAGKSLAVAGCWALGAATLPAPSLTPSAALLAAVFVLVAAGAVLCDLKDVEGDRAAGVRSLAVVLGPRAATATAFASAILAAALALAGGSVGLALSAAAVAGVASLPARVLRGVAGPVLTDAALALPALALLA